MKYSTGLLLVSLALYLTACETTSEIASEKLHPFVGCWDSSDRMSREGWTVDPSGWLIGYSANRDAGGKVTFFEHMRVEDSEPEVLVVTGADGSQTRFTREMTDNVNEFRFVNAEHDFPQVITYRPTEGRLDADISLLDGVNKVDFPKAACK